MRRYTKHVLNRLLTVCCAGALHFTMGSVKQEDVVLHASQKRKAKHAARPAETSKQADNTAESAAAKEVADMPSEHQLAPSSQPTAAAAMPQLQLVSGEHLIV